MKLNKYIKLKENQGEDLGSEKYDALMERVRQNQAEYNTAKKQVNLWKIFAPILSVACAIAITLTCVFALRSPDDFVYNDDIIASEEATFQELTAETKYFDFCIDENYIDKVSLSYYPENNDKLYYNLIANIDSSIFELIVVINKNYEYDFQLNNEPTVKQLSEYEVNYNKESTRGKPQINYRGWIKVQTETVYFDYVQKPASGDEAFFATLEQNIKVKK